MYSETRKQSIEALSGPLKSHENYLTAAFKIVDQCIELCEEDQQSTYLRVCALTTLKAKNYALCMYSLILDGYGQESGACARPFLEYLELLTYFREDPNRIGKALQNNLPSAGAIAKEIDSSYQGFRSYLNEHASHKSFSDYSMSHLVVEGAPLKLHQPFSETVLRRNLRDLFAQIWILATEIVNVIQSHDLGRAEAEALALEVLRQNSQHLLHEVGS